MYVLEDPGPNILYRNNHDGTFTNVAAEAGAEDPLSSVSVGLAAGDYDNDGFLDLYIANVASQYILYKNDGNANHWLKLRLTGSFTNRSAIGARVEARIGEHTQVRVVGAGCGFQSQNSLEVELGFGQQEIVEEITIQWPSGVLTSLHDVDVDQVLEIVEEAMSPVLITVEPEGNVFAWGDTLRYEATATNLTGDLQVFDVWAEVRTPWGKIVSPVLGPRVIFLTPHHVLSGPVEHIVPRGTPIGGAYRYILKAGSYPDQVWSQDGFDFSIIPFWNRTE
jgi:hypothetical protein